MCVCVCAAQGIYGGGAIYASGGGTVTSTVEILGCGGRNNTGNNGNNALHLYTSHVFTDAALYVSAGHTDWAFVSAAYPATQPCPLQPLPPSAVQGSCPANGVLSEGQACNLTCDTVDGSGLIGDPTARCSSGLLVWKALCTGADPCPLPSLPLLTQPISGDGGCRAGEQLFTGGTCNVECEAGYAQLASAGASYEYSCVAGNLTTPTPNCQPCPVNHINPLPGAASCTKCSASNRCSTSGKQGQTHCDCIAECVPTTPNPHQHWINSSTEDECLLAPNGELLAHSRCVTACDEGYIHMAEQGVVAVSVYRCTDGKWVGGNWKCELPVSDGASFCTKIWLSSTVLIGLGLAVLLVVHGCRRRQSAADQATSKLGLLESLPTLIYAIICAVLFVASPCATAEEQWRVVCIAVTVGSKLSLPVIMANFDRSVRHLQPLELLEGENSLGLFGLLQVCALCLLSSEKSTTYVFDGSPMRLFGLRVDSSSGVSSTLCAVRCCVSRSCSVARGCSSRAARPPLP